MYFTPSKFGVASKLAINFQKLAIYTLNYYNDVNINFLLLSITILPLTCLKMTSFLNIFFLSKQRSFCYQNNVLFGLVNKILMDVD